MMGGSLFSCPSKPGTYRVLAAVAVVLTVLLLCWTATLTWRQHAMAAHSNAYDVRVFGAKGNGITIDTVAVQRAIDRAAARGGGIVVFPAGRYLSGTLHLRSNVSLRLSRDAVLLASLDDGDFDPYEAPPPGSISPTPISWTFANKFHHREVS